MVGMFLKRNMGNQKLIKVEMAPNQEEPGKFLMEETNLQFTSMKNQRIKKQVNFWSKVEAFLPRDFLYLLSFLVFTS